MDNTHRGGRRHLGLGLLLVLASVLASCSSDASDPLDRSDDELEIICPSCGANVGGETGDFGAEIAACATAYEKREFDRDEADALGFDGSDAVRTIETPIDSAMTWVARDTPGGGPAHGYDDETRVHLALTVDSLTYHELDLALCDDDDCRTQGEEGQCIDRFVMVSASGELRTDDGAIATDLATQNVRMLRADDDELSVTAQANLHDVTGSLQLDTEVPEPRIGVLDLSLQYTGDGSLEYGVIDLGIYRDWDALSDDDGVLSDSGVPLAEPSYYSPLQGRWGSPPPIGPATGRPMP